MKFMLNATGLPLQDLVFGASVYFLLVFSIALCLDSSSGLLYGLLRGLIYAGDIWHPLLMDLLLFAICVCLALAILIA